MPALIKPKVSIKPGLKPAPKATAPAPAIDPADLPDAGDETAEEAAAPAPKAAPKVAPKPAKKPGAPSLSFLKRGAEAQAVLAQEEKKIELRKSEIYRYWVPQDGAGEITFLDGNLTNNILDVPYYHEHNVKMNGNWGNFFICTQDEEPCPICEGGMASSYVGILTVIDHSSYTSKKDGKTHSDNVKLFVAKRDTIKLLQTIAIKRGGLRGCRFDVSRVGDKSPSCGSAFDFTEKLTEAQLVAKYKEKAVPTDYEKYLAGIYQPASELRKLGFGIVNKAIGSEAGAGDEYEV